MKSISELTDFYYKSLFPTLQKLEKDRKKILHRMIFIGLILTSVAFIIAYALGSFYEFVLIGYIIIGLFIYRFLVHDYISEFKNSVIRPLVHVIDNSLEYSPSLHVAKHLFENSNLFLDSEKVSGNDYVKGKIDGISIEFSDLHAERKTQNSKGKDEWSTLFRGLFIVAEFNKNFSSQTVVLPDNIQSTVGNLIGHWLQSNNGARDELVKMDNPEFEAEFVVYSNDQIEARYILSHSLMEKLLSFRRKSANPIHVAFRENHIYMAISYNKDLFEPSIFRSLLEYKIAMEYVKTLHLAIGIVEELKLNQKLWSKR